MSILQILEFFIALMVLSLKSTLLSLSSSIIIISLLSLYHHYDQHQIYPYIDQLHAKGRRRETVQLSIELFNHHQHHNTSPLSSPPPHHHRHHHYHHVHHLHYNHHHHHHYDSNSTITIITNNIIIPRSYTLSLPLLHPLHVPDRMKEGPQLSLLLCVSHVPHLRASMDAGATQKKYTIGLP